MNDKQAADAAQQIMANDPVGSEIWFLNQGMMEHNPHWSEANGDHSDGYYAVKGPDGQITVDKYHVPGK